MYHAPKVVLITDFFLAAWVVFWVIGWVNEGMGDDCVATEISSGWKRGTYGRTGRMRVLPF